GTGLAWLGRRPGAAGETFYRCERKHRDRTSAARLRLEHREGAGMRHRPASRGLGSFGVWALGCVFLGCASQTERGLRESLAARASVREASGDDPVSSTPAGEPPRTRSAAGPEGVAASTGRSKGPRRSGDVQSYVARAMEESPALKSAFERWRANVSRVSRGRRLPDPVLSFG